jgi:hypothetical protein
VLLLYNARIPHGPQHLGRKRKQHNPGLGNPHPLAALGLVLGSDASYPAKPEGSESFTESFPTYR